MPLNVLTVSLSTQNIVLTIASLSFILVSILCELAMLPVVHVLLSPQEEEMHPSSWEDRCTHLEAHLSKGLTLYQEICHYISMPE